MALNDPPEDVAHRYRMTLSLTVLDDLGLNLYSSIPAVLGEAVANAWDADAPSVHINLDPAEIVVEDWGVGMSLNDVNEKFLTVGYKRREAETATTAAGRHVMGRKGIGKLSLFAIADSVRVETRKDGCAAEGFLLRTEDVRAAISDHREYYPTPLPSDEIDLDHVGTRLLLTMLKVRPTGATTHGLRTRIARRFSVIGPRWGFEVR